VKRYAVLLLLSISILVTHATDAFDLNQRQAYISNDPCQGNRDEILYVNGIWNAWEDADDSLFELQKRSYQFSEFAKITGCIAFSLAYNHTNHVFDLVQASAQFIGQDTTQFWLIFAGVVALNPEQSLLSTLIFRDIIVELSKEAQSEYDAGIYLVDEDLKDFVFSVNEKTKAGSSILVVAHSQGNFYANEMHRLVDNPESMAIVAVATPASTVESPVRPPQYITLFGDLITLLPLALLPNITNGLQLELPWQIHSFINSYMAGENSRNAILSMMTDYLQVASKFQIGDRVETTSDVPGVSVLVFDTPEGTGGGTQELGAQGAVTGGPRYAEALGFWVWNVNFDTGQDGWVAERYLRKVSISPLNDTGITWGGEYPSGNNATCTSATTDITAQDCSHGRDVTHNDDSDGHAGFSFTKLDSNGNPLPASATSWTCMRDNVTGLIWEVKTDDGGLRDKAWNYTSYDSTYADAGDNQTDGGPDGVWAGPLDNGSGSFSDNCANQYKICTTEQYVADVNMVGLCGAHNWRMPTAKELENITDKNRYNPMIDTMAFPNTRAAEFWSSSPFAGTSYYVWYVDFYRSGAQPNSYRYHYHPVRLVRGGLPLSISPISAVDDQVCKPAIPASTPTSQFIDHGDGTVTDARTNLMWNRCAYGQTWDGSTCTGSYMNTTWHGALQEPAIVNRGSGYAGYTDWRLPNINELRSLVEEQCYSPAINLNVFPNTPGTIFWSSSPNAYNSQIAWGVHFFSGSIDSGGRSNDYLGGYAVRLVRGGK